MTLFFSTNQEESLDIIRTLILQLQAQPNSVILHHSLVEPTVKNLANSNVSINSFRHKLALVELYTDYDMSDNISDHYDEIIGQYTKSSADTSSADTSSIYHKTTEIELYDLSIGSKNSDITDNGSSDLIDLTAQISDSQYECAISYTTFVYDSILESWIIKDTSADNGIGCNGVISILDFSEYAVEKYQYQYRII